MNQAQYSTEEQLQNLRILAVDQEYDLDDISDLNAMNIVKIANFFGLYDAADFVREQIGTGKKITLEWRLQ